MGAQLEILLNLSLMDWIHENLRNAFGIHISEPFLFLIYINLKQTLWRCPSLNSLPFVDDFHAHPGFSFGVCICQYHGIPSLRLQK